MRNFISAWMTMLFALWVTPAFALQVVPLSIGELTAKSDLIAHGTVRSVTYQEDSTGRIYTEVEIEASEIWKGTNQPGIIHVLHGGGVVGSRRVVVSGQVQYPVGEEVVAFLVFNERGQAITLGLAQGKFHVRTDAQTGEKLAANPFHGIGYNGAALSATPISPTASRLTLGSLKQQVQGGRQ
jgi:hypothetical protein